jgi:hypothetical protein
MSLGRRASTERLAFSSFDICSLAKFSSFVIVIQAMFIARKAHYKISRKQIICDAALSFSDYLIAPTPMIHIFV